jgi:hypothetical protein
MNIFFRGENHSSGTLEEINVNQLLSKRINRISVISDIINHLHKMAIRLTAIIGPMNIWDSSNVWIPALIALRENGLKSYLGYLVKHSIIFLHESSLYFKLQFKLS